jgi:Protein of unknown function (DUF2283)
MKITHNSGTDALTVVLRDGPARIMEEEKSGVILDHGADDRLVAIEILDASTRVDVVDTVDRQPRGRASLCGGMNAVPWLQCAGELTYQAQICNSEGANSLRLAVDELRPQKAE